MLKTVIIVGALVLVMLTMVDWRTAPKGRRNEGLTACAVLALLSLFAMAT